MDLKANSYLQSGGPDLVGMSHPELETFIADLGKESYRAAQVMKWIHQGLSESFQGMTNLSKALREELSARSRISRPEIINALRSDDGTSKFLLRLEDGLSIETVLIPGEDHDTLCLSTQVGCAMGCRMCRTSKMGLVRNLTAGEIVSQLLVARESHARKPYHQCGTHGHGRTIGKLPGDGQGDSDHDPSKRATDFLEALDSIHRGIGSAHPRPGAGSQGKIGC